jgi:hypothetical protein
VEDAGAVVVFVEADVVADVRAVPPHDPSDTDTTAATRTETNAVAIMRLP